MGEENTTEIRFQHGFNGFDGLKAEMQKPISGHGSNGLRRIHTDHYGTTRCYGFEQRKSEVPPLSVTIRFHPFDPCPEMGFRSPCHWSVESVLKGGFP